MKQIINLNKPISITPLEAVKKFQKKNPEYKNKKIGYAGRLDPMAEGILLLLIEDINKEITKYMNLDKTYKVQEISVVAVISTPLTLKETLALLLPTGMV